MEDIGLTDKLGLLKCEQTSTQFSVFSLGNYDFSRDTLHFESDVYQETYISLSEHVGEVPFSSLGISINVQLSKRRKPKPKSTFSKGLFVPGSDWTTPIYKTQLEANNVATQAVAKLVDIGINAKIVSPSPDLRGRGFEPILETDQQRHIYVWVDPEGVPKGVNFTGPNIINNNVETDRSWLVDFSGNVIYLEPE
ncbi:MAG: hypothetical protein JW806_02740 [Sedimentisphaerales bacterium]|nr:hypothetical protein [Sedimentisphaerales bacterium]